MRLLLRFVLPLLLAIGVLAYIVLPFVDRLMVQWFVNDLDLRSKLISSTVDDSLFQVIDERSKTRIQAFFDRIAEDKRLYALGFCDTNMKTAYKTTNFPQNITCPTQADSETPQSSVLQLPSGPLHVAYHYVQGSGRTLGLLVLVHDMSFVATRSESTNFYLLVLFLVIGLLVAMITMLVARLTWKNWMQTTRTLLQQKGRRSLTNAKTPKEMLPIVQDLRHLIQDMEMERRRRDESHVTWNPRTLKSFLHEELSGDEVIVVSNREPYIHVHAGKEIHVQRPASGLVTSLEPIMRACSGTWVAHGAGSADREVTDKHDHVAVPPKHPLYKIRRIWLTPEEEQGYYYGFSNEGLWPLCHNSYVRPTFRSMDWDMYREVNQKFANAVLEEVKTDDPVILVQDYLLALVPQMLRAKLPKATIITFWHIPWPNPETFGVCPWTEEILEGLLGSSILGFHTRQHGLNFVGTVERFLECRVDRASLTISYQKQLTSVNNYPISIEFPPSVLKQAQSVNDARDTIRKQYSLPQDHLLGVGVDRLDYTKGIVEKFQAVERLLELHPEWIGKFSFLQIAAPSRTKIEPYKMLHENVLQCAERINERFGDETYKPIILRNEHIETEEIFDHYRASELCFVNSLHDGMHLGAKEFIASRDDEQGVLILSQFTGAAREFPEALIVNPYHIDQCASALQTALTMYPEEQRDRVRSMRGVLREFNIYRWAGRMLLDAAHMRQQRRFLARIGGDTWNEEQEQ